MKILHISYHDGCIKNLNYVQQRLSLNMHVQKVFYNYNIGYDRALSIWEDYKDYYNSFDIIIVSDTCPLSRIFLQNNYKGKLIIQICNRFDYSDIATNDCNFPDENYYNLISGATDNKNVKFFSYTQFEHEYARKYKNIELGQNILKPCGFVDECKVSLIPQHLDKSNIFFIPQYHNDSIFMNLSEKCNSLGIDNYQGRYNGPNDLIGFKGIIHIPYAWSNLALFENWSIGNIYLIPSKDFLIQLKKLPNFFWSPPFDEELLNVSEWYCEENKNNFIYFNSWSDLSNLVNNKFLIKDKKETVLDFIKNHNNKTLALWHKAIYE